MENGYKFPKERNGANVSNGRCKKLMGMLYAVMKLLEIHVQMCHYLVDDPLTHILRVYFKSLYNFCTMLRNTKWLDYSLPFVIHVQHARVPKL